MRRQFYLLDHTRQKVKPWYERDGGARLAHDRNLIAAPYPGLKHRIDSEAGRAFLEGQIKLCSACKVRTSIELKVDFSPFYPRVEPFAYDVANRFDHKIDRHFFPNGGCCLWLPPESAWNPDDPKALLGFLDQVAIFFDKQLVCDALGGNIWPGEARGHGAAGFVEYVLEFLNGDKNLLNLLTPLFINASLIGRNGKCVCGRSLKYKRCHYETVEEIRRRVGPSTLREMFLKWSTRQPGSKKECFAAA